MNKDLNKLSKEIYYGNKSKGFHDKEQSNETLFMLVITELAEAVDADRKGRRANIEEYNSLMKGYTPSDSPITFVHLFETHIKDTIEDELADAAIRLFDLAGLRGYSPMKDALLCATVSKKKTFPENIFSICKDIAYYKYSESERVSYAILNIERLCEIMNIDLWKHVELKLKYNSLRPHKHGKLY